MPEEAVILAGGFGTRLRDVVSDLPKPMAPVCGRPFLEYLFRYLQYQGVRRVVLSVGYLHEKIENHFGKRFGDIEVDYFIEKEPLGTGGGIRAALGRCFSEQVAVLNGDTFFDIPLSAVEDFHARSGADATLGLRRVSDAARYGTVETKADLISAFHEKNGQSVPGLINAGVYLLPRERFIAATPAAVPFSIERDFFEKELRHWKLGACAADGYFIDIGIPSDYQKANDDFRQFRY